VEHQHRSGFVRMEELDVVAVKVRIPAGIGAEALGTAGGDLYGGLPWTIG
jgi:hypothetical protein